MAARARPSSTAPRRITKASSGSARSARSRRRAGGRRERTRRLRFSLLARSAAATFAALRGARLRARGLLASGVAVGVPAAAPQGEGGPRDQAPDGAATLVAGGTGRLGDALLHIEGAAARAAVLVSRHEAIGNHGDTPVKAALAWNSALLHHPDGELAQRRTDHSLRARDHVVEDAARRERDSPWIERDPQLVPGGDRFQDQLAGPLHTDVRAVGVGVLLPAGLLARLQIEAVDQQLVRLDRVQHVRLVVRVPGVADQ